MEQISDLLHENFYSEVKTLLQAHPSEWEIFNELWAKGEYRWAYKFLNTEAIPSLKIQPSEAFLELNEHYFTAFIE